MVSKHRFVERRLRSLENSGLYRHLNTVVVKGPTAMVDGKRAVHMCSNDYLGLSQNKYVIEKTMEALQEVSQCSSRLIAGNHPKIMELEGMLAEHRGTESALVYPTGYSANLGAITAMAGRNSTIFSDELNHASIIDACRLSGATVKVFRHNDVDHLEDLMLHGQGRKIMITEGIFSMNGDTSRLQEICEIAKEHHAMTIVDDAHGDFIFGPGYSGTPSNLGIKVDVHVSSMSKGLGCFGGYVAASKQVRELMINAARQFIYTSALPGHLCSAAIVAIPLAKKGNLQKRLQKNIKMFSAAMDKLGFVVGSSAISQIIPVNIGQEKLAVEFSNELLKEGVFVQAIRYPTVKKGSARLRVSLTAMHTRKHLDLVVNALEKVGKSSKVI